MRIALVAVMVLFACNSAKDKEIAELKAKLATTTKPPPLPALGAVKGDAKPAISAKGTEPDDAADYVDTEASQQPTPEQVRMRNWATLVRQASTNSHARAKLYIMSEGSNTKIKYSLLKKNPDRFAGQHWHFTGKIQQITERNGMSESRISLDYYGQNAIYVIGFGETDFVERNIVDVLGIITGSETYTSIAGWKITLPGMFAILLPRGTIAKYKKDLERPWTKDDELQLFGSDTSSPAPSPPQKPAMPRTPEQKARDLESEYK